MRARCPSKRGNEAAPWIVSWMVRQLCDSGRAGISKLNDLINSLGIAAFCRKDASREVCSPAPPCSSSSSEPDHPSLSAIRSPSTCASTRASILIILARPDAEEVTELSRINQESYWLHFVMLLDHVGNEKRCAHQSFLFSRLLAKQHVDASREDDAYRGLPF